MDCPHSASPGQQQQAQQAGSRTRTIRRWDVSPCEPQLAPVRTRTEPVTNSVGSRRTWQQPHDLTMGDILAECPHSPGTGRQFSARCQGETFGPDSVGRGDRIDLCDQQSEAHALSGYEGPPIATVQDTGHLPKSIALQRLRERRLSAHVHVEHMKKSGVSRSALTVLRQRREHTLHARPSSHKLTCSTAGVSNAVGSRRQSAAVELSPVEPKVTLNSTSGYNRSKGLLRCRRLDSDEKSEDLAGTPIAPPQISLASLVHCSPVACIVSADGTACADLASRLADQQRQSGAHLHPPTPMSVHADLSNVHDSLCSQPPSHEQPSPTVHYVPNDLASEGPVGEGFQFCITHQDPAVSGSHLDDESCELDHFDRAHFGSDLWVLDSPRHDGAGSQRCVDDSGSAASTPRAVVLTRQLFCSAKSGNGSAPGPGMLSDAVGEGCTWSGSQDGVAESWTRAPDPALVWRGKPHSAIRGPAGAFCLLSSAGRRHQSCCAKLFRDIDTSSTESSPRIQSVNSNGDNLPILARDVTNDMGGAHFERNTHCITPRGSWCSDGGGCPLSTLLPRLPPLLRGLEQSGSFSAWSGSPARDLSPEPPWLPGPTQTCAYNALFGDRFGALTKDPDIPPHRHSAPAGPVGEGSSGWAAGLRRGRLYGSNMHDNTSRSDTLHHGHSERAREFADTGHRGKWEGGRRRRATAAQSSSPTRSDDLAFNDEIAKGAAQVVQRLYSADMQHRAAAASAAADAALSKGRYRNSAGQKFWPQQPPPPLQQEATPHSGSRSAYHKQQLAADALAQGRSSSGSGSGFSLHAKPLSPAHVCEPGMSERRPPHRSRSRSNSGGILRPQDRPAHVPASPSAARSYAATHAPSPRRRANESHKGARTSFKHNKPSAAQSGDSNQLPQNVSKQTASPEVADQCAFSPMSSPGPVAYLFVDPRPSAQLSPPLGSRSGVEDTAGMRVSGPRSIAAAQLAARNYGGVGASAVSATADGGPDAYDSSGLLTGAVPSHFGPSTVGGVPSGGVPGVPMPRRRMDRNVTLHSGGSGSSIHSRSHTADDHPWGHKHVLPQSRAAAMRICRQLQRKNMQAKYDDLAEAVNSQLSRLNHRKTVRSHATPPFSPGPHGSHSQFSPSPFATTPETSQRFPLADSLPSPCAIPSPSPHADNLSSFSSRPQYFRLQIPRRDNVPAPRPPVTNDAAPKPATGLPSSASPAQRGRNAALPTARRADTSRATPGSMSASSARSPMSTSPSPAAKPHNLHFSPVPSQGKGQLHSQRSTQPVSPSPPPTRTSDSTPPAPETSSPMMSPSHWSPNPLASSAQSGIPGRRPFKPPQHHVDEHFPSLPPASQGLFHGSVGSAPLMMNQVSGLPSKGCGLSGSARRRRQGGPHHSSQSLKSAAASAAAAVARVGSFGSGELPDYSQLGLHDFAYGAGAVPDSEPSGGDQAKPAKGVQRLIAGQGTALQKALLYMRAREDPARPDNSGASAPLPYKKSASAMDVRQNGAFSTHGSGSEPHTGPLSGPQAPRSKTWRLRNGKWVAIDGPGPEAQGSGYDGNPEENDLSTMQSVDSGASEALAGEHLQDHLSGAPHRSASSAGHDHVCRSFSSNSRVVKSGAQNASRPGRSFSARSGGGSGHVCQSGLQHTDENRRRTAPSEVSGDGASRALRGTGVVIQRPRRTSSPYRKESLPGKLSSLFRALTFRYRPRKRSSHLQPGHAAESMWRVDSSSIRHAAGLSRSYDFEPCDRPGIASRQQGGSTALASPESSSLMGTSANFSPIAGGHSHTLDYEHSGSFLKACCFGPPSHRGPPPKSDTQKLLGNRSSSWRAQGSRHQKQYQAVTASVGGNLHPLDERTADRAGLCTIVIHG